MKASCLSIFQINKRFEDPLNDLSPCINKFSIGFYTQKVPQHIGTKHHYKPTLRCLEIQFLGSLGAATV